MRRAGVAAAWLVAAIVAGSAGPAAADVSVGSNLGFSVLMPSGGGDNVVLVTVPAGAQVLLIGTQPGLRIGFTNAERRDEVHLDTGLSVLSGGGSTYTTLQIEGNYQHAFGGKESGQPFVTGGLGMDVLAGEGDSVNRWRFGIGVGHRQFVADGHGSVRGELRYNRIAEHKESGYTQPGFNVFEVRLGFDLWGK